MKNPLSDELQKNLRLIIDQSSFRSDSAVGKQSNVPPSQMHAMLNTDMKNGPGVFVLARVAETLGVGVDQLLGLQAKGRPSFNDLIQRWATEGRNLSCLDYAADYFDVYYAPDQNSRKMKVYRIGKRSLASQAVGVHFIKAIQFLIDKFGDEEKQKSVIADYRKCCANGMLVTVEKLHVPAIGKLREPLDLEYQRLLLSCDGPKGPVVVNYSIPFV